MTNKLTTENWCRTHINVVDVNFTWTISNFSFCKQKPGEALESTVFWANSYDVLKWCMQFYPSGNNTENKDYVSLFLHLVSCDKPAIKVDFRFCILDKDGREANERKTTEKWQFYQGRQSGFPKFVRRDFLMDPANGLLQADKLCVVCRIRSATGDELRSCQDTEAGRVSPEPLLVQLSDDFRQLFEGERFSDVTIEASGGVKFPAHKNVLAARSPVFAAMFVHDMKERQENVVKVQDVEPDAMWSMLGYLYTGRVEDIEVKASKLIGAADKYALEGLKTLCERVLCRCLSVPDAAECLLLAELHTAEKLKSKALTFIRAHLKEVMETQGFKSVSSKHPYLLEEILKSMALP